MGASPALTRVDRAQRHQRMVAAYRDGLTLPAVAARFGLSYSQTRAVVRLYGATRPRGRPQMARVHVGIPDSGAVIGCRPNKIEAA
jgi:hypothetical protein